MIFYYNNIGYPMNWKSKMNSDMFYNMEPAKIKVTLPYDIYRKIYDDLRNEKNEIHFKVLKRKYDKVKWSISEESYGLWSIDAFVYSLSISSKFRNGDVTMVIDIGVFEFKKFSDQEYKSVLRDELLKELV
jgi:hypothetical protein